MMELAERMAQPCVLADLAAKVTYNDRLTDEEQEMSAVLDESIRKIGETGHDPNHELAALVKKTFTPETVSAPSAFMEEAFDEGTIGEFDDYFTEVEPKNTIQVHEATIGGNVDASYIEHKIMKPTWKSLQAEVYIPMRDIRRGGYKTVANYTERINQALEDQKICDIIKVLDAAITSTHPGYIAEATGAPTVTSADQLALYLQDMVDNGNPVMFALNKYIQAMSKLAQGERWPIDTQRNMYTTNGFLEAYAGARMFGYTGQRKMANGELIVPDKRVFGVAGKIGNIQTRGEARVLEDEDINRELVHLKVTGYTFGWTITDIAKAAKIVMAQ